MERIDYVDNCIKEKEVWKDIDGYEGLYQISNFGNVKRLKTGKLKKPEITNKGYYMVDLYKNNVRKKFTIHRLIAKAFIDNPRNKKIVNHKDGNKLNNDISNLEWSSYSQNNLHAYRTGLKKVTDKQKFESPESIKRRSKPVICLNIETGNTKEFSSISEAGKYLNVPCGNISRSCKKGIKVENYKFRYI